MKIKHIEYTAGICWSNTTTIQSYLLFMLKYHYSASFIPSGKQFSRIVELNRWNDVS